MKKQRKPRALNKSDRYTKEILELFDKGMKPMDIYRHYQGKFSYWQIYNTVNPRLPNDESLRDAEAQGIEFEDEADSLLTNLPDEDLASFASVEKFIEHQITVIIAQLNSKRISLKERTLLIDKLVKINQRNKAQQLEHYLKNASAKLIIRLMRRMNTEITDEEILKAYKEEAENLKKESEKYIIMKAKRN